MNEILISIIIPSYNQAEFLEECLVSVIDQTYQHWECIIINDGSNDNTDVIAKKWQLKDSRIKYLLIENSGVSVARNIGIQLAKGEWILPLDSDDKIAKDYLELASMKFNSDYRLIYCNAEKFGDVNGVWNLPTYSYSYILRKNIIFCSAFFRKKDWEKVGGYNSKMIYGQEDWDFWLSILNKYDNVYKIPKVCFFYRIKKKSRNMDFDNSKRLEMYRLIRISHCDKLIEELGFIHYLLNKYQFKSYKSIIKLYINKLITSIKGK